MDELKNCEWRKVQFLYIRFYNKVYFHQWDSLKRLKVPLNTCLKHIELIVFAKRAICILYNQLHYAAFVVVIMAAFYQKDFCCWSKRRKTMVEDPDPDILYGFGSTFQKWSNLDPDTDLVRTSRFKPPLKLIFSYNIFMNNVECTYILALLYRVMIHFCFIIFTINSTSIA